MSDPFSPWEKRHRSTFDTMKILSNSHYPTVVSTKGAMIADDDYLSLLRDSNTLVRFSVSILSNSLKSMIEPGVPSASRIAKTIETLSSNNVKCFVRIQPIMPGFEDEAVDVIRMAKNAGAVGVSAEFLKVPIEESSHQRKLLDELYAGDIHRYYIGLGANTSGREYVLPLHYKQPVLEYLDAESKAAGIDFHFAELELLHRNKNPTCCNSASTYLQEANDFTANFLHAAKQFNVGESKSFEEINWGWLPDHSVDTYLNSRMRVRNAHGDYRWVDHLRSRWNSKETFVNLRMFYGFGIDEEKSSRDVIFYKRLF